MLLTKVFRDTKKLQRTKHLLVKPKDGYVRPKISFDTTTTVWRVDELIKKRVRDWMKLLWEDGYSGTRESVARKELTVYTGTYSVFPIPLAEWILVRYGGEQGNVILDAFAGGPPRGLAAGAMGFEYHGFDINEKQIESNRKAIKNWGISSDVYYHLGNARHVGNKKAHYDFALTCPPYWNVEVYSDDKKDFSNFETYGEFDVGMNEVAEAHALAMKPGSFVCIVVGNFRNKKTGELIDFRGDTVRNFQDAGFLFHQDVILSKNFGSAAKRSTNSWKGKKLVSTHEHLLVFLKPENKKQKRIRL